MSNLDHEIEYFDRQADRLLSRSDEGLLVTNPYKYLAGTKIAFDYFLEVVGNISDKRILDLGCGSGWLSTYFAKMGANFVHGFDISPKMIEVAKKRAKVNGVSDRVVFESNVAEKIEFEHGTFDYVVGISVLHHIDLMILGNIIKKILAENGKAVFIEPLGENKVLEFVRNKINLRLLGKRTEDEKPLRLSDIEKLSNLFKVNHKEFQLLGSAARYIGNDLAEYLGLNLLDGVLFKLFPATQKKARLSVISLLP